jgi:hypothetical protein
MESTKELSPREHTQSGVLDRLPFNLTQLLAFAMQKPRNPIAALDNAVAQLRAAPQFASKAYYTIPFKKSDGTTEVVEGPSIKAATALTGCWGNNVEGGFMGEETPDYVDVSGYFFDYETGKLTIRPWRVSKTYRTRDGKTIPWRKDMLDKQIAAGVSKAIRNADLNGLPMGFVAEYYAEAKRIAARGGKAQPAAEPTVNVADIEKQIGKSIQAFEALGVEASEVQNYIGRHPELTNEEDVSAHLIGLLNALNEGLTTIDEVFTVPTEPIPEPQRTEPPPAAAKQEPPPAPPSKELPKDRRRMQARFASGTCSGCKGPIRKDDWIYKDTAGWHHETGPMGKPC